MQSKQRDAHMPREEELDSSSSNKLTQDFKERSQLAVGSSSSIGRVEETTTQRIDGYKAARIWKWARQYSEGGKHLRFKLTLERTTAKRIYQEHKEVFDRLAKVFAENKLSPLEYIKFFAIEHNGAEAQIDQELLDPKTIMAFEASKQANVKKKQIYTWFMKSVNNIAEACVENGWFTTKDFMRHLINEKKLAGWYASGKISKYYLAAIPNFWKIIPKLDYFSKLELKQVAERYDIYHTEVNEAFLKLKKFKINPIALTDAIIYEKRHGIKP